MTLEAIKKQLRLLLHFNNLRITSSEIENKNFLKNFT